MSPMIAIHNSNSIGPSFPVFGELKEVGGSLQVSLGGRVPDYNESLQEVDDDVSRAWICLL